jgi:hypothetical protein
MTLAGESMKPGRNEIDSGKETGKSRNYDTLFGNGLASSLLISVSKLSLKNSTVLLLALSA